MRRRIRGVKLFWSEKPEAVEPVADDEIFEIRPRSSQARYSQPLESNYRDVGEAGVLYAGFMPDGSPGFILRRGAREKPIQVEASAANRANERPAGFFRSLAQLWASGGKR